ncbi:MAG: type II toxin-antitoxin system VapC family toxin [Gemmatimonadota bacterium]
MTIADAPPVPAAKGIRRLVIDASVSLKWVIPESHSSEADRLRQAQAAGKLQLHVPELWIAETGNALWVRTRRGLPLRLSRAEAARALTELMAVGLRRHRHADLVELALVLACDAGMTVYDATYLALAVRERVPLVTADEKLIDDASAAGHAEHVVALRDVPAFLESAGA